MAGRGSIAGYPKSSLDIGVQCSRLWVSGRALYCSHGTRPVSSLPGKKPSQAGWVSLKRTPGTQPSAHHKNSAASPFTLLLGRASNHRFHLPTLSGMEKLVLWVGLSEPFLPELYMEKLTPSLPTSTRKCALSHLNPLTASKWVPGKNLQTRVKFRYLKSCSRR